MEPIYMRSTTEDNGVFSTDEMLYEDGIITAKKGDSIYVPENVTAMVSGKGEIIYSVKGGLGDEFW